MIVVNMQFILPEQRMNQTPPLALVKTWYDLLSSSEDNSVKQHAQQMLLNAFESPEAIATYLKANNILKH
jgi:hypothetical protein